MSSINQKLKLSTRRRISYIAHPGVCVLQHIPAGTLGSAGGDEDGGDDDVDDNKIIITGGGDVDGGDDVGDDDGGDDGDGDDLARTPRALPLKSGLSGLGAVVWA